MQNLIQFIIKYGHILAFLLLELFAFSLIVQKNQNQQDIFLYNKDLFFGKAKKQIQEVKGYLSIAQLADSLAEENAKLRAQFRNAKIKQLTIEKTINDSLWHQMYSYIPAKVIQNAVHLKNNTIMIDKGSLDSIQSGMGVIAEHGVVGVVSKVSEHFARITPIIHRHSRISVAIRRNGYFGTLRWYGPSISRFVVEDIPKRFGQTDVKNGDLIITSGYSTIFPKGIEIGLVSNVWVKEGSSFYTVELNSFIDMATIKTVYVVRNLYRQEFDELLNSP